MQNNEVQKVVNYLLALLLLLSIISLTLMYLYNEDTPKKLMLETIPSMLSTAIISLITLIVIRFFIPRNKNREIDSKIHKSLVRIENALECNDKSFRKSNKQTPSQVFHDYLELENNCLDYLCLCSSEGITDSDVHPNIESRLKGNNIRNITVVDQIEKYKDLALSKVEIIGNTSKELQDISQGALQKIILDVEHGGVFYYIFDTNINNNLMYIFGATVDQDAMDFGLAYREMEAIFDEIKGVQ